MGAGGGGGVRGAAVIGADWPLYEVFVRGKRGLNFVHAGSLRAASDARAVDRAFAVYTRRGTDAAVWVVRSTDVTASAPAEKEPLFAPSGDKVYRHPTFYSIPEGVPHI